MIVLRLSALEMDVAQECAEAMVRYNQDRDYVHRALVQGNDPVANMALGNRGEMAFAAWLGVPWTCAVGAYAKTDVAGYHVRTRRARDPRLIVQPQDPDAGVYVLCVEHAIGQIEIAGWATGRHARLVVLPEDPGGIDRPAHFVPRDLLMPMLTFPMPVRS